MFKQHPKGLFVAFFTNMGERFGFYTMMAILVLFLQAKYGLTEEEAGGYYSWFYFSIYALALVGGMLADWSKKYKLVILIGQVIMFAGYVMIALPGMSLTASFISLLVIALGNGLFKGNLQAVVGQLYDGEKYRTEENKGLRDKAFMIFYMGINVGAFFAPFIATSVRNGWLKSNGYLHDGSLPALCHQMLNGKLANTAQLQELADKAMISGQPVTDLMQFSQTYLDVFSRGYNWAFAVAAVAMIISLLVYTIFNKMLPSKQQTAVETVDASTAAKATPASNLSRFVLPLILLGGVTVLFHFVGQWTGVAQLDYAFGLAIGLFVAFVTYMFQASTKDEKPKIVSLCLVFVVVLFFWMSFHQNGLTLTYFARDYTVKVVDAVTNLFFNLTSILAVIATIGGAVLALRKSKLTNRLIGMVLFLIGAAVCVYYTMNVSKPSNPISPEVFQSFNPLFIVALTPVVMGIFALLAKKGREPSTPRKIGYGMVIAAVGFVIVLVASLNLISPYTLNGAAVPDTSRVSPYWLMSSYLVLTIAELFLSPIGISFVSKVAPSRFQGLMQGGWLLATAVGNKLLFVGSIMWKRVDLYMLWGIFIICCVLSALFIFSIMKKLEKATNG
ncbi:MAG: peptide MFS transporter [Tannerella sp.]|jgi:POT family proton-dependent oligopeptide transporter|nr:peptide MFS transporter [Tannerella sp.]